MQSLAKKIWSCTWSLTFITSLWYSPDNGSWSQATTLILIIIRVCFGYFVSPTTWPNGTILFVDQNVRPQTPTLPLAQSQPESITSANILFTLVIDDASYAGQTHTVKIDCTPAEWENLFELDGGRVLEYRVGAAARQTQQNDMCAQRRFRSAWVSAQSDQSLHCALNSQIHEPPHVKTNKMACTPSEHSDQPGHTPSLIRVYAVRIGP